MMPGVCLQFVIVVFPDYTHLLFLLIKCVLCCDQQCQEYFANLEVRTNVKAHGGFI